MSDIPLSRFEELGASPERYAAAFARQFVVLNNKGEFVKTEPVMAAWFCALTHALDQRTGAHIAALEAQVHALQRAFDALPPK